MFMYFLFVRKNPSLFFGYIIKATHVQNIWISGPRINFGTDESVSK